MSEIRPTHRVALVVSRSLGSVGEAANVAALMMGQLVAMCPEIYATEAPVCHRGYRHAGIRHSTVILKAGPGQLLAMADMLKARGMSYCVFSRLGQSLNNEYDSYRHRLMSDETVLVGVGLYGEDQLVRDVTKKFSLLS